MTVEEFLIVIKKMGYDPDDFARHLVDGENKTMTVEEFMIVIKKMGYDPDALARHLEYFASEIPNPLLTHPTWGEGMNLSRVKITELRAEWRDTFADIPRYPHFASSSPYLSVVWEDQKPKSISDEDRGITE